MKFSLQTWNRGYFLNLMRNFFQKSLAYTVFISEASEAFPLKSGVRQGFLLLLLLFISLKVLVKVRKRKDETRIGKKHLFLVELLSREATNSRIWIWKILAKCLELRSIYRSLLLLYKLVTRENDIFRRILSVVAA